ncbi:uncharacterized protein BDR25DRAFT_339748, partial [Lindgomyces ingoldianus]
YTTAAPPITTTSTITATDSLTTTPATVTATFITGYKTIYAPRITTTKTSTITPKPVTRYTSSVSKVTTTVTCLGGQQKRGISQRRHAPNVLIGRAAAPGYETPNCGPVVVQTVYTSTIIVPVLTTTT